MSPDAALGRQMSGDSALGTWLILFIHLETSPSYLHNKN